MPPKLFRFTQFPKNAFATPLVSHTFKTTIQPGMVVLSEHREPKDPSESCKPFRLIQFRKNMSASPLESHTFKTKDLKPFRFTHLQKKGGGYPLPLNAGLRSPAISLCPHGTRITGHDRCIRVPTFDCQLSTLDRINCARFRETP